MDIGKVDLGKDKVEITTNMFSNWYLIPVEAAELIDLAFSFAMAANGTLNLKISKKKKLKILQDDINRIIGLHSTIKAQIRNGQPKIK